MSEPTKDVDPRLASLTHFVHHTDQLAEHTMNSVEWEAVEVLMPRILRGKSKEDIKQLLLAEIDGMSEKRLLAVLAGETLEESSSSEEEEEEEEEMVEDVVKDSKEEEEKPADDVEEGTIKDEEEPAPEAEPEVEGIQDISEDEDVIEPGEIKSRSVTPQDPSPSKPDKEEKEESIKVEEEEELDTDEEIDRQLEEDLQDFI
ncbi:unnamed protein product [Caenorhabditis nigoni]